MAGLLRLILFVPLAGALYALPTIGPQGIVSAASFTAPSLPNGSIAQGSIFSIFGQELGPTVGEQPAAFPLPEELGGVSITITQGEVTLNAIPLFVRADQINAIMPSNAPLGRVIVRVTFGGDSSNGIPANVVESNVELFAVNSAGFGPGVVQNVADDGVRTLNSINNSASPGQVLILWGVGLGPVEGADNVVPTPEDLPVNVEVYIGGVPVIGADLLYAGRSGCCAGLDQIAARVPESAPRGCYVPVDIRTNENLSSNAVTIAISDDGGSCADPANPFGDAFLDPGRVAMMMLFRLEMANTVDLPEPVDYAADFALSVITDLRTPLAALSASGSEAPAQAMPGEFFFNSMVSLPPVGACLTTGGRALNVAEFPVERKLDAGAEFQLSGPGGPKLAVLDAVNSETLGGMIPGVSLPDLYLSPGTYTAATTGGTDVGGFEAPITVPATPDWSNRDEVGVIDRSQPLLIEWSIDDAQHQIVALMVFARSSSYKAPAAVMCLAEGAAGSFEIPARYLSSLPASAFEAFSSLGVVMVGSAPRQTDAAFEASGLDAGVGVGFAVTAKQVILE